MISVSLGSSRGDYEFRDVIGGVPYRVRRLGTNGSWQAAAALLQHFDGRAAALGLGGVNRRFILGQRQYTIPQGELLSRIVRYSPLADGERWKMHLEPRRLQWLLEHRQLQTGSVGVVSWLDRYPLVEFLEGRGFRVLSGDAFYALGWPRWMSGGCFRFWAACLMPLLSKLPIQQLYPLGEQQDKRPRSTPGRTFRHIDLLVGDTHLMLRRLPARLRGIGVVATTLDQPQRKLLQAHGAAWVDSLNPMRNGRAFGANLWEALALAVNGGQQPETPVQWLELARKIGWSESS